MKTCQFSKIWQNRRDKYDFTEKNAKNGKSAKNYQRKSK